MLFLFVLYRRLPWIARMMTLAVLFLVFITTILRVHKAVHAIQERNAHVHTRRNLR